MKTICNVIWRLSGREKLTILPIFEANIISSWYIHCDLKEEHNLTRACCNYCHAVITERFWLNIKNFLIFRARESWLQFYELPSCEQQCWEMQGGHLGIRSGWDLMTIKVLFDSDICSENTYIGSSFLIAKISIFESIGNCLVYQVYISYEKMLNFTQN